MQLLVSVEGERDHHLLKEGGSWKQACHKSSPSKEGRKWLALQKERSESCERGGCWVMELTASSRGQKNQNVWFRVRWRGDVVETSALQEKFWPNRCTHSLPYFPLWTPYTHTHTHLPCPWYSAVQGAPDGRSAVALHCCACCSSLRPAWCLPATAESRAEMAGVDSVPPEGILSLPNAAAPQLLAVLLNQRRRHKVKRKSRGSYNNSVCVCVCQHGRVGGKRFIWWKTTLLPSQNKHQRN